VISEEKNVNALLTFKSGMAVSIGTARVVVCKLTKPLKEISQDEELEFSGGLVA
jgi:hypothetical protein